MNYELYLDAAQDNFVPEHRKIDGETLLKRLRLAGAINQSFKVDDSMIQGWISRPETYPDKLKPYRVCLWGALTSIDPEKDWDIGGIPSLKWDVKESKVIVELYTLSREATYAYPALIKPHPTPD